MITSTIRTVQLHLDLMRKHAPWVPKPRFVPAFIVNSINRVIGWLLCTLFLFELKKDGVIRDFQTPRIGVFKNEIRFKVMPIYPANHIKFSFTHHSETL